MRQLAGGLNRGWLAVIGIVLLVVGAAAALATTGVLGQLLAAAGVTWSGPAGGSPVVDGGATGLLAQPVAVVALAVLGVILGLLGLAWLLAQIPRTNAAQPYRLHDDAVTGLTVCPPDVLATAVADDIRSYAGVNGASAVLRGTSGAPELTVKVSADDRTDLRSLLTAIRTEAATNLSTALDAPLAHLGVQLDIDRGKRTTSSVTL
jgi:hypothetical protein